MSDANRDIQASHQLLALYEKSKLQIDQILDDQPVLFAIIDSASHIYRTNEEVARQFGQPLSRCIGIPLSELFSVAHWRIFMGQMDRVLKSGAAVAFELPLDVKTQEIAVFWRLEPLRILSRPDLSLLSVVGQNISDLRRTEKQLAEVFATAPIGILTIDSDGLIAPEHSAYCEWLFDATNLTGRPAQDVIFDPSLAQLETESAQAIDSLFRALAGAEISFEELRPLLPVELPFISPRNPQTKRWLRVTYHPLEFHGRLRKVLILVEDRTTQQELIQLQERASLLREAETLRVVEIKRCRVDLMKILIRDFVNVFDDLNSGMLKEDWTRVKNALHAVKGNANIVNFSRLAELAHDSESFIASANKNTGDWKNAAVEKIRQVVQEWSETRTLIFALHSSAIDSSRHGDEARGSARPSEIEPILLRHHQALKDRGNPIELLRLETALKIFNSSPLAEIETKIREQISQLSKAKGKEVQLECQWNDLRVDAELWNALSECIMHLINNSIAHGIESPEIRESVRKENAGKIGIQCVQVGRELQVYVWDDGRGIEIEKVRKFASQRKLISLVDSLNLANEELMQLIFAPDFSTREVVDQTSGRGVGLSSVTDLLRRLGGKIRAEIRQPCGVNFRLQLPAERGLAEKRLVALSELISGLESELQRISLKFGLPMPKLEKPDFKTIDHILFCAPGSLTLALSTIIARYASEHTVHIKLTVQNSRCIFDISYLQSHPLVTLTSEFSVCLPECFTICFNHQGEISQRERDTQLAIGQIIGSDQFPVIKTPVSSLSANGARETLARLKEIAHRFSIQVEEVTTDNGEPLIPVGQPDTSAPAPHFTINGTTDTLRAELVRAIEYLLR